jgi:hypothetical protein
MNEYIRAARRVARGTAALVSAVLVAAVLLSTGQAGADAPVEGPASTRTPPAVPRNLHPSGLEERMRLLTAELGLDVQQQSDVRKLLQEQREQVMRIWSDNSLPAAYRINATRAIGDKTADRIRALLSTEQKAKYIAPRKPHESQPGESKLTVEEWMKAGNPK